MSDAIGGTKLADIFRDVWSALVKGTEPGRAPFKVMQLATTNLDGSPDMRAIVVRRVDEARNTVVFHTDARSPKIAEIANESRVALAGVDAERNVQIRIYGEASIHRDEATRRELWDASRRDSLNVYRVRLAPGTPINDPADAHSINAGDGFEHFCVLEIRAGVIDWLDLSAAGGHERARFVRVEDEWRGRWISP